MSDDISVSQGGKASVFEVPDKNVLDGLVTSCAGDIRGAINALQFTCLKGRLSGHMLKNIGFDILTFVYFTCFKVELYVIYQKKLVLDMLYFKYPKGKYISHA